MATDAPEFPIGGPTGSSWREHALATITELEYLKRWLVMQPDRREPGADELARAVDTHLKAAYESAGPPGRRLPARIKDAWGGAGVERSMSHLNAAVAHLLELAPLWYVDGQMPSLLARVRAHLRRDDPRLQRLEQIAKRVANGELTAAEREQVVAGVRGAGAEARGEVTRVRSFRNVLLVVAGFLAVAATAMALLGSARPDLVHLCFNPDEVVVCPTGQSQVAPEGATPTTAQVNAGIARTANTWDILVVELVGLIGAAVAGAAALRGIKGTSTPYSLPVAVAVLKMPTGALTALLGILLMRGEFIPGLTALDSPGQILAWAIVFGSAQQLVTRLVDQRAQTVLEAVGGGAKVEPKKSGAPAAPE